MAVCGNCKVDFPASEVVGHARECASKPGVAGGRSAARSKFKPDMDRVRTVSCANPFCSEKQTGRVGDLLGWRCAAHGGVAVAAPIALEVETPRFVVGTKVLFRGKRFEILEVLEALNSLVLRTGGKGQTVPMDAVEAV